MRMRFLSVVMTGLLIGCSSGPSSTPTAKSTKDLIEAEKNELEGTWIVIAAEQEGGRRATKEELEQKALSLTFAGGRLTIRDRDGVKMDNEPVHFDLAKKPKQFDIRTDYSDSRGIYEIEGGQLKFCFTSDKDKPRPTTFSTQEGDRCLNLLLRRKS